MTTSPAALRRRWQTPQGRALAEAVWAAVEAAPPGAAADWAALPLGTVDGRTDLRGLPVPRSYACDREPRRADRLPPRGGLWKQGLRLERVDLSHAWLQDLVLVDADVVDCVLDGCDLRHGAFPGSRVTGSSARGADLRSCGVGAWWRTGPPRPGRARWEGVDLSGAKVADASWDGGAFTDVDLLDVAWGSHTDFGAAVLVRCRLGGTLNDVWFSDRARPDDDDGLVNGLEGCDLSAARLRWLEFRGVAPDGLRWPAGDDLVFFSPYRPVLEQLPGPLRAAGTVGAKVFASLIEERLLRDAHPGRLLGVWGRQTLGDDRQEIERVVAVIREVEARCGGPVVDPVVGAGPAAPGGPAATAADGPAAAGATDPAGVTVPAVVTGRSGERAPVAALTVVLVAVDDAADQVRLDLPAALDALLAGVVPGAGTAAEPLGDAVLGARDVPADRVALIARALDGADAEDLLVRHLDAVGAVLAGPPDVQEWVRLADRFGVLREFYAAAARRGSGVRKDW